MEKEKLVALVTAGQKGDAEALNSLFNAFYNDVYYFALKTVKDQDLACDITQETFLKLINSLGELKEPAAFVTWMKQITYHECVRYFKKKKEVLADGDEDGGTVFDNVAEDRAEFIPDEALDQQDFRNTILAILDGLSPEQRAATMLYYYDEMPVKQIAEIQGVSENTVKSRLNYARKTIKSSVEDYEKKNNVKLHSVGLFPLIRWLFQSSRVIMPAAIATVIITNISAATGITFSLFGATAAAAGTGLMAALAALPPAAKAISVAAAVLLVGGSVGYAIASGNESEPVVPTEAIVMEYTGLERSASEPMGSEPPATEVMAAVSTETTPEETAAGETRPAETNPADETVPAETEAAETEPDAAESPETEPAATEPEETEPGATQPATEPTVVEPEATEATEPPATEPEETEPTDTTKIVPSGCTYITADGTTIEAGGAMPEPSDHDQFVTVDYTYTYSLYGGVAWPAGWGVEVNDQTKSSYSALLSEINGEPVTSLASSFWGCTNMTTAPAIPSSVTLLECAFQGCSSLTTAPQIPSGVTDMGSAFRGCTSLTVAPSIPSSVTDMESTFYECSSLVTAPVIPAGVTSLRSTFTCCTSLVTAPVIPSGVTSLYDTFEGCSALTAMPAIPQTVTTMEFAFYGCTSLTAVTEIPASVTNMAYTFAGCTALTGEVVIQASPSVYGGCFEFTTQPIALTGSGSNLAELAATSSNGNVTVK